MKSAASFARTLTVLGLLSFAGIAQAEVLLQWFETDWDEMYQKLPKAVEAGYDSFWIPPPTKGPVGTSTKWANVGYNLYDRFDVGDVPQRGSVATRYGTRGSLRNMIDNAHHLGIKIIPDIVMNHYGNGPDFRDYPGMTATDFHVQWSEGYCNTLNYKRAPRMNWWYHQEGYGATMWTDLANLADLRTEDHPLNGDRKRFTGQKTDSDGQSFNFVDGTSYLRHVGQYDRYPYYPSGYTNENAAEVLYRWIAWLGNALDYDGLRLDAGKHTPYEFFGWRGSGFLHEAQWSFKTRRGYEFGGNPTDLFSNDRDRTNAFIFAEILSPWSEIEYWYRQGTGNPMRFLDYAMKKSADACFTGNLSGLGGYGSDFGPSAGVTYVWGHDEALASGGKANLAYAYILSHVGVPMVFYTGNNISWADYGRVAYYAGGPRTWMMPGYDDYALGEFPGKGAVANMVWINQNFARGNEYKRYSGNSDFFALERYDDKNGNGTPDAGEGLMLLALNDSGGDKTESVACAFPNGTVLKDFTGNNAAQPTVSGGYVSLTVGGNGGQGWAVYAPLCADGVVLNVKEGGATAGTMTWICPGGATNSAPSTTYQLTRITNDTITVETFVTSVPGGIAVDNVMLKWGNGVQLPVTNYFDSGRGIVSGRFHNTDRVNATNYSLTFSTTNLPEGLNVIKARAFTQRDAAYSAIYNTQSKVVYVDRHGPDLSLNCSNSFKGDALLTVSNFDFTAYQVFVKVDNGSESAADMPMKGTFRYALSDLGVGAHTVTVRATEYNYANPRAQINQSIASTTVTVTSATALDVALSCADTNASDSVAELPFFKTIATGGASAGAKLYWEGYELPWNGGSLTNVFNGEVVQRDNDGRVVTNHLWGNFVNGAHFFVLRDGADTVVKRVVFNLYGKNHVDSDGDGLPDNVEMPYFDDGAPGPDQSWPGDSNNNFIPDNGESWSRLNPYNHSTFYSAQWDDRGDMDGDGVNNYDEVYAGYVNSNNIYAYGIYNAAQKPTGGGSTPSSASCNPATAVRGSNLVVSYTPNSGTLSNAAQVVMHVGHSKRTLGSWQDVIDTNMTAAGASWTGNYLVPSNATSVDVTFFSGSTWDGADWQFQVAGASSGQFVMDKALDSAAYEIASNSGMKLWAAVRGTKLYVATWGSGGGGNDHCIYVSTNFGDACSNMPGWNKQGSIFLSATNKPFLAAEGDSGWAGWFNAAGTAALSNGWDGGTYNYLEGEIDLVDNFGSIPAALYMAVGAYATTNNGRLNNQVPAVWDSNEHIDVTEILRVPTASILDDNGDGYFDGGNPVMQTVVNASTNDGNYGLRRFFLDEVAGDQESIRVLVTPNVGGTNAVTAIELFSNLNRRDYVKLPGDEDPGTVTTTSLDTYYKAYAMTNVGSGVYAVDLPVNRCGAYRINARWKVNGGTAWHYYTDNGLRRDCAVVVSPKKALNTSLYELNPLTAEATNDTFFGRSTFRNMYIDDSGRPNGISTNKLNSLGVNMIWLQPIHPIGTVGREIDASTGSPYDPGSPYAVRNYWQVNSVLGDPATTDQAMTEFTNFVANYDAHGVGVMLDGTFNHSAWDCEIGEMGVEMGLKNGLGVTVNATSLISAVRAAWYSKKDSYGEPASYFTSTNDTDIAVAPDRIDFGKWSDAADFFFGKYDCLVQKPPTNPGWPWGSGWYGRYQREDDLFEGFTSDATRELWEYFSSYPSYWIKKTGHPAGTAKSDSYKGIDGLRCDFAQGVPSLFWEYTINKTRSLKWDFLFMAESLDGYHEVNGSKRHGIGYRSSRHFDILNENILYLWRDDFFDYRTFPDQTSNNPNRTTALIWNAFDARKNAFEMSPVLLNLISHDEIFPTDDQWSLVYAYAINAAMDGVPMMFYGQEMGAQNDIGEYGARTDFGISSNNNFGRYEINFSKSIPHFKRYNHMTNIWNAAWAADIRATYGRLNAARANSPALRSQQNYFLADMTTSNWNADIFAVAKFQQPGVSAATQDVVFAFVNNNFRSNYVRAGSFNLGATTASGANWFGIQPTHVYNVVNIAATNPTTLLWGAGITGSTLIANGIYVGFASNATWSGGQAQYIRLLDTTAGMTATNVNDMFANADRYEAPVLTGLSNRTVAVSNTLAFTVNYTKEAGDSVTLSCASTLAPDHWTFTAPNSFSFTPTTNDLGVHSFLFTATGIDGFDEQMITITVTAQQELTPYQQWASDAGVDPEGANGGTSDDYDGDGWTNEQEYWSDTDPADTNSFLHIQNVSFSGDTLNILMDKMSSNAAPRAYVIHTAHQLSGNGWDFAVHGTNSSTSGVIPVNNLSNGLTIFKITIPAAP